MEIGHGRAQHLVAVGLQAGVRLVGQVADQGGVALGIGQLVGVHAPDGPDDGRRQGGVAQVEGAQEVGRAVVGAQGGRQIRVAVGQEGQRAGVGAEAGERAIGPALNANLRHQVIGPQHVGNHRQRAVAAVAQVVEVGPLGHVVDGRGEGEAFALGKGTRFQGPGSRGRALFP